MIGKTISHYRILEEIGRGGMGVVYKAEDTRLQRTVALKFLPPELTRDPEAKARFIREAQAASALDHPNICTVHEIGETEDGQLFIVMAGYDGQTLKEKMVGAQHAAPVPERSAILLEQVISIIIQIAEGLAKAHEKGIIHRDIKPANIFITNDGLVKILDFGLAKLAGQAQLTKDSSTLGTVAYMSPEQLSGKEVDQRTDIWSLGVVLYEMLTGELPFPGDYEQAIIYAILNNDPLADDQIPSSIFSSIKHILNKMLKKEAGQRYQSVNEILEDLDLLRENRPETVKSAKKRFLQLWFPLILFVLVLTSVFWYWHSSKKSAVSESSAVKSLAVLPFVNMSGQIENEYFSDGLSESIINALTKIKDLRIVARTSSFAFKGQDLGIQEIAEKLNVQHILEGSIQRSNNRLRITAQLINTSDGFHLWSQQFDRELKDIFAIQDEIALAIVDRLQLDLLPSERAHLVKRYTNNIDAYNDYLMGHYFWNKRTAEGFEKSIAYYQSALEKDPDFVLPYAGLADVYASLGWYDIRPKKEVFDTALTYASKALEIDNNNGQAHAAMANYLAWCEFDFETSEKEYQQAIRLNPSEAEIHHQLAHIFELRGLSDQAIDEMQRAINLEPLTVNFNTCFGQILFYAGQLERASQVLHTSIEIDSTFFWSYYWLGRVYHARGQVEEALRLLKKAGHYPSIETISLGTCGYIYARLGKTAQALKILNQMLKMSEDRIVDPLYISWIYLGLGDWENTFHYLDQAYQGVSSYLPMIKVDSFYDTLRSDARFKELLRKMGLENKKTPENKK